VAEKTAPFAGHSDIAGSASAASKLDLAAALSVSFLPNTVDRCAALEGATEEYRQSLSTGPTEIGGQGQLDPRSLSTNLTDTCQQPAVHGFFGSNGQSFWARLANTRVARCRPI
jgi:hypothetical protein